MALREVYALRKDILDRNDPILGARVAPAAGADHGAGDSVLRYSDHVTPSSNMAALTMGDVGLTSWPIESYPLTRYPPVREPERKAILTTEQVTALSIGQPAASESDG
jgi:hypothetical protein